MKPGEAMFRVASVNNETQTAFNDKMVGVRFSELLDPKRYELLYRGEGVARISKPGTPATPSGAKSTPQNNNNNNNNTPPKVDVLTENKYFGKNKNSKSATASQSRFYERFHVYAVDISGVVEVPESSALMTSKSLNSLNLGKSDPSGPPPADEVHYDRWFLESKPPTGAQREEFSKWKPPEALYSAEGNPSAKKLEEDEPLNYSNFDFDEEALSKSMQNLEPLPIKMHPSPSKALKGDPAADNGRPNTASFTYLQACKQNNVAPWNLVTKCENPSSPTLNLKGLAIGEKFSDCLCEGLKNRSMDFLERIDFSDNRLNSRDVAKLLESSSHMPVRGLSLGKNRIGVVGGKAVLDWLTGRRGDVQMEDLDLSGCDIGENMIYQILGQLVKKDRGSLRRLGIGENRIKGKRIKTDLVDFLSSCTALETLDLSWNSLKGVGASDLLKYLAQPAKKTVLRELRLGWNGIAGSSTHDVLALIKSKSRTIKRVELNNNNFAQAEVSKILVAAEKADDFDVELEVLDIDVLGIKDKTFGAARNEYLSLEARLDEIRNRPEYKKPVNPEKTETKGGKKKGKKK
mmetsp:Transcript_2803/g.5162  ORF Transcript_2803/g.5162 Transcript_2803/m.5162 type:complete len:575 (+) Transcript_2803:160-1884(+)